MPATATIPDQILPFRRAIDALFGFGRDLLERLAGARALHTTTNIPRRLARDIPAAERRVDRAMAWVFALTRVLAGDCHYLPQPGDPPPAPARPPSATPRWRDHRPSLDPCFPREASSDAALLQKIRRTFATTATNVIVRGIARRLGVRENSDFWPGDLLAITQTPAAWAEHAYRTRPPHPPAAPPHAPADPPPNAEIPAPGQDPPPVIGSG